MRVSDLRQAFPLRPDPRIQFSCGLRPSEFRPAVDSLAQISDGTIAEIVAGPPQAWHVSLSERIALAQYLARRRDDLVAMFSSVM